MAVRTAKSATVDWSCKGRSSTPVSPNPPYFFRNLTQGAAAAHTDARAQPGLGRPCYQAACRLQEFPRLGNHLRRIVARKRGFDAIVGEDAFVEGIE